MHDISGMIAITEESRPSGNVGDHRYVHGHTLAAHGSIPLTTLWRGCTPIVGTLYLYIRTLPAKSDNLI